MSKHIVIVYHSGYGHTRKIAEAVAEGSQGRLLPSNAKAAQRDDVNYLSSFAGLATATPSDASPDEMASGDIQTATLFGRRIRETAERLSRAGAIMEDHQAILAVLADYYNGLYTGDTALLRTASISTMTCRRCVARAYGSSSTRHSSTCRCGRPRR